MSSISSSDNSSGSEILRVEKLGLAYRLRHHRASSLRETFTGFPSSIFSGWFRGNDSLHVLKNISFTLRRGDRVALLGVNGSGKTSLCRCIAGILQPSSGAIQVHGIQRAVFNTQVSIIPELTGRENAKLLARLLHPKESALSLNSMVEEALEFSGLAGFLDVPYETYSLGMKSRLCLSLITARSCDLLVLDEVYDNTDEFFQKKMRDRFDRFIQNSGAVIFVSHSTEYIRSVCNRAIVLHEGRAAYDGTVEMALKAYRFLNAEIPGQPSRQEGSLPRH